MIIKIFMRLLDPFAGIKLATGHMLFHFSFYIGSFVVDYYHDPANWCVNDCETVLDSENMQRKSATIDDLDNF